MNGVITTAYIRKDQICFNCKKELPKGSKVIVNRVAVGRKIIRTYYCLECGKECE